MEEHDLWRNHQSNSTTISRISRTWEMIAQFIFCINEERKQMKRSRLKIGSERIVWVFRPTSALSIVGFSFEEEEGEGEEEIRTNREVQPLKIQSNQVLKIREKPAELYESEQQWSKAELLRYKNACRELRAHDYNYVKQACRMALRIRFLPIIGVGVSQYKNYLTSCLSVDG